MVRVVAFIVSGFYDESDNFGESGVFFMVRAIILVKVVFLMVRVIILVKVVFFMVRVMTKIMIVPPRLRRHHDRCRSLSSDCCGT